MTAKPPLDPSVSPPMATFPENIDFYRKLLNSIPGMIYQFRQAIDGKMSFSYVSAGCQSLFQVSVEAVLADATCLLDRIYPPDRPSFYASVAQSAQTLEFWQWEGRVQVTPEQVFWVEGASQPEQQPTGEIIWNGVLIDVTHRKSAEDAVRLLNQDLEQRVASRTLELNQAIATLSQRNRFFDISQDLLCTVGFDGYFKRLNPQWEKTLGFAIAELQARPFIEFVHPEDRAATLAEAENITQGAITLSFENRYLCKDGSIRWLQWQAVPVLAENILYASARDVSDRKQVEQSLMDSEMRFRGIVESAYDMIFQLSAEGQFCYVSPNAVDYFGYTPKELEGQHFAMLVHPEDVFQCQQALNNLFVTGEMQTGIEYRALHKTGTLYWHTANVTILWDANTETRNVIGFTRDITTQRQVEACLRSYADRQALLNQLTNQIRNSLDHDTIIDSTLQAIHQQLNLDFCGLIWFQPDANPPAWDIVRAVETDNPIPHAIGVFPATEVGPIEERLMVDGVVRIDDVAQHDEPQHRAYLQQMGCQSVIEVRILLQDGQLGILAGNRQQVQSWTDQDIELLQAVAGQLAIALNQAQLYAQSMARSQELAATLTELQHTQMQMIQSEKMSSLGQLVAGVAHEINNPVNFIYGNLTHASDYITDLLGLIKLYQHHYPEPIPDILDEIAAIDLDFLQNDLLKLLNSMKVGADRIQAIVASLRTFSRMDEADKKPVNIHDGIDSTLMILQNRTKAKHNRLEIQILKEYGNLPLIECYSGQLNQVFMNILVNAIDALEEQSLQNPDPAWHPTITMQTEYLPPTNQPAKGANSTRGMARIRISDNGAGMPETVRSRIFDPFYTTKPVGKGTGMGMSISYQIITEKHEGTLTCESTPSIGTEFTIEIPANGTKTIK